LCFNFSSSCPILQIALLDVLFFILLSFLHLRLYPLSLLLFHLPSFALLSSSPSSPPLLLELSFPLI
jgi:hypothetical protein